VPGKCLLLSNRSVIAAAAWWVALVVVVVAHGAGSTGVHAAPDASRGIALADLPPEARAVYARIGRGARSPMSATASCSAIASNCCRRSRAGIITNTRCGPPARRRAARGESSAVDPRPSPKRAITPTITTNPSGESASESARFARPGNCRRSCVVGRCASARGRSGAAKLRYFAADLKGVDSKAALLAAVAKGLKLPEHFGSNWDALADAVEDSDWLGKSGCVIGLSTPVATGRRTTSIGRRSRTFWPKPPTTARTAQAVLGVRELSAAQSSRLCAGAGPHPRPAVLLIERADAPGYWQSVTGSQEPGESLAETAAASCAKKPASMPKPTAASSTGSTRTFTRSTGAGATDMRRCHAQYRTRVRARASAPVPCNSTARASLAPVAAVAGGAAKCFSWSNRHAIELLGQRAKSELRRPA